MTAPNIELAYSASDETIDLDGLISFLKDEESRSVDDELTDERAVALDFYNGEPFGDEEDGRSQFVTRDVAEVVDQATTSIMGVIISGDSAVEFDVRDKKTGKAITAAVGQEFFQGQDGYRVLHDWIKAGLLEKSSVAKVCVEYAKPERTEATVSVDELTALSEQGVRIIAAAPVDEQQTMFHIAYLGDQAAQFRDYVVPNEEMRIAQDARDLDDDCAYSGFFMPKTVSQIAEMGFDTDDLEDSEDISGGSLSTARDGQTRSSNMSADYRTGPNRRVWLKEEYARFDLNRDGIAELLKIHRVGDRILVRKDSGEYAIEEMEEQPGVVWCPFPMPSRIVGQSLADKVMDIQRGRSFLLRQAFDNLNQSNSPRWTVAESSLGDTTIDDLLTSVRPGGIVRYAGAQSPTPVAIPFVAEPAFTMAQLLSGEKESRTGITRLNQGLNPDAINTTATGTAMMMASGQQMEDYMARNFAEGFARLMMKKYRLMRQYAKPMTVLVDGEEITTNPQEWPADAQVRVRVGLGTGRKDQRLAHRMNLLQIASQAAQLGMRIFTEENIYAQVAGVIEDSALGQVSEYVTDPAKLPPAEPEPDPKMAEAQAKAMIDAERLKQDQAKAEADNAIKTQQQQIDAQLAQQQTEYTLQAKREEAALDEQLARDRAQFEADLALRQQTFEEEMALRRFTLDAELGRMKVEAGMEIAKAKADATPENRPGGNLSE